MWDLVPQPGIKPGFPALMLQRLSHWTIREVPRSSFLQFKMDWSGSSMPLEWFPPLSNPHLLYMQRLTQFQHQFSRAQTLDWSTWGQVPAHSLWIRRSRPVNVAGSKGSRPLLFRKFPKAPLWVGRRPGRPHDSTVDTDTASSPILFIRTSCRPSFWITWCSKIIY